MSTQNSAPSCARLSFTSLVRGLVLAVGVAAPLGLAALAPVVHAAWPDGYEGRVANMNALRQDFAYQGVSLDNAAQKALYDKACTLKSTTACNYPQWFGPSGGDIEKAAAFYTPKCGSGDPQACTMVAISLTRDGNNNFLAKDAKKAYGLYEKTCTTKAYAPACAGMAELMMRGQGVAKDYVGALKRAEEACKAEDPYGCHLAGELYANGWGTKVDTAKAISNYKAACKGSVQAGCLQGALVEAQAVAGKDPGKAIATFTKYCDQEKFTAACYQLGKAYDEGRMIERDYSKAETYYKRTCDVGDIEGCFGLARLYEDGKVESASGAEQAVSIYDKACNAGNTDACARLGKLYIKGKGVAKDVQVGVGFISRACESKDAESCDVLGQLYEAGNGVDMNLTKAGEFYDQACKAGTGVGCFHLAKLYQLGKGVSQDLTQAGKLFEKACATGHGASCSKLASGYLTGEGVPKDLKKAAELLDKGCNSGDGDGCVKLGGMYAEGKGVTKDLAKSSGYYDTACRNESGMGCYYLAKAYEKGEGVPQDFKMAVQAYKDGCRVKYEQACSEGGTVMFQAKFQEILDRAWESKICQVWTIVPGKNDSTKLVADVRGDQFSLLEGPFKGQTLAPQKVGVDFEKDKKYRGTTRWAVPGPGGVPVNFRHFDVWDSEDDPIDAFPGDLSRSPDRQGATNLVYNRGEEVVQRNAEPDKCVFPNKAPMLTTEHCSELQALLAAQLVSTCKGE